MLGVVVPYWGQSIFRAVGVAVAVLIPAGTAVYLYLFKMVSFMQSRLGPMEAGPYGSMQLFAEVGKFLQKEDLHPDNADRFIFKAAIFVVFVTVFLVFLLLMVVMSLSAFFEDYVNELVRLRILMDVRRDVCAKLLEQPMTFYDSAHRGDVVQRVLDDVHGFAAGLIYGRLSGRTPDESLRLGWAHGALLTTFPGDVSMARLDEVEAIAHGGSARVQR